MKPSLLAEIEELADKKIDKFNLYTNDAHRDIKLRHRFAIWAAKYAVYDIPDVEVTHPWAGSTIHKVGGYREHLLEAIGYLVAEITALDSAPPKQAADTSMDELFD